jgi:DNA-binding transcriptional LysR family regulator
MGDHLDRLLEAMRQSDPQIEVQLAGAPTQARLDRVRARQLDAAFVRGITSPAGIDLVPVWQDPLVVALPASHPLAARARIELATLAQIPLRIVSRRQNAPLVDLVMSACARAGFEPLLGEHPLALQDTLAAIGTGRPSWTVLYAAHARGLNSARVAFRPTVPPLVMTTALAVPAGASSQPLAPLLRACAQVASSDQGS